MRILICPGCAHNFAFNSVSLVPNPYSTFVPIAVQTSIYNARSPASQVVLAAVTKEALPSATTKKHHSKSFVNKNSAILELERASDVTSVLERVGGVLRVHDLNVTLRNFGEHSRWQEFNELFNWMQLRNRRNASSYSTYFKFIGRSVNPSKALDIYNGISDQATKANVIICNSLLNCLVRNGKFDISLNLFHQMKRNGLVPDAITFSTLLVGCNKSKDGYSMALDLIQEMKYNGIKMDSVMYGTLLAVCATNNKHNDAQNFFEQMKMEGILPNEYHYSSLLNAYSVQGDYKMAEGLVQDMKSSGLVPNKVIMTTLLKVYVKGGLFEKGQNLLRELEVLGFAEDEIPYCILMDGFAKTGQLPEARLVYEELSRKSVKSNGYAHSIMISAFCRAGLWEEAKHLAKDIEATYSKYDVVILNTMLCAYCRTGEMESVMATMQKMDKLSIAPDRSTFRILIKYFFKEKLFLLAYQTLEDMQRKGHQPDEELCSSLIVNLGKIKAHEQAFAVYKMLRYSKRTMSKALHERILNILISGKLLKDAYVVVKDNPNCISQSAMKKFLSAFIKHDNVNMINDVIKTIHATGYRLDQDLLKMTMQRYLSEPEKKFLFLQFLQWMNGQGYTIESSLRNFLLKHCPSFYRQTIAQILSKQNKSVKMLESL